MSNKPILAVIKRPGEEPFVDHLFPNMLESFQKEVGGYIEAVTIAEDLVLIVNEEGRLLGLPENTTVCGLPLCGTIVAVGRKRDEFASIKAANVPAVMRLLKENK